MKLYFKLIVLSLISVFLVACDTDIEDMNPWETLNPKVDTITSPSGDSNYEESTYDYNELEAALQKNAEGNITPASSIATVNDDGTPNVAVFTSVSYEEKDGTKYLTAYIGDETHTYNNLKEERYGVFFFYEYDNQINVNGQHDPSEEPLLLEQNKGCKVVVKYVGDDTNDELSTSGRKYLEIIEIIPLG